MDFSLTEEQNILQKSAADFLAKHCPKELVRQLDESDLGYSPQLWQRMAELGWMGLMLPEEYGGSGFTFQEMVLLLEAMGYNLCPGPFFSTTILGAWPIFTAGSEEQKQDLLPKVAAGELKLTMAVSEPGSPVDPALKTRARPEGDGYLIQGVKSFVPDAQTAGKILVPAAIEGRGLTLFLIDAQAPGIEFRPLKTLARDKQCEVVLDGVSVGASSIIGAPGSGWEIVEQTLDLAAAAKAAEMVGGAQAVLDMAMAYSRERVQFDRPIGSFQAIQHHLANMWMDVTGARHLVNVAAWKFFQGEPAGREAAMAKARAGRSFRRVTTLGHQIFGGIGFAHEHDMHLYHRRSISGDQAFGSGDYHYERTAAALGL